MDQYLKSTPIINWNHPKVNAKALELSDGKTDSVWIARRCFEWVRDEIHHAWDARIESIACTASEVLELGAGLCYAKSHLLAALLRANSIPCGICYQRLSLYENGAPYCLHGLNAVYLPEYRWYRIDPRGNKEGVNAQFTPPIEQLAFPLQFKEEYDLPEIYTDPLPEVVSALRYYSHTSELMQNLPDHEKS